MTVGPRALRPLRC